MFLIPRAVRAMLLALSLPIALMVLGGCATTNPRDPLEPMNRVVYSFNDGVDTVLFKPLSEGYRAVVPSFVRTGISNFFANINDILIALNNLLQGKVGSAVSDLGRVLVNTTIGVAGLFDVASDFGLEKHNEDFGQTLGYWGIGDGPYLVLPLLGPSSLRDTLGRFVDAKTDPVGYVHSVRLRNSLWGARFLNQRAELLDTSNLLETAALDPYEFLRDAYLQRRRNLVHDGSPPRENDEGAESRPKAPRASSPFPSSAEGEVQFVGTPLPTLETPELTPARNATRDGAQPEAQLKLQPPLTILNEPVTSLKPAGEVQRDVTLPAEPTAAGGSAAQVQAATRIVRVWAPATE